MKTCPGCGRRVVKLEAIRDGERAEVHVCAGCAGRFSGLAGARRAAFLVRVRGELDRRTGGTAGRHAQLKSDDKFADMLERRRGR